MFVRTKKRANGFVQVQIVESVRNGKKISQKILRNVGQAKTDWELEEFVRLGEAMVIQVKNARKPALPIFDPADIHTPSSHPKGKASSVVADDQCVRIKDLREQKRIVEGYHEICGQVFDELGVADLINDTKKDAQWNELLRILVLARIFDPGSKRHTAAVIAEDFDQIVPLEKVYRMLDHLYRYEDEVRKLIGERTIGLFDDDVDVLFFDVTTLYFESIVADGLREFGYSKDCKFKETQVVLALVSTTYGLPITYRLFPGNTYEGHTLVEMIRLLRSDFKIAQVTLIADRAMFTEPNLALLEKEGVAYIVAAKLRGMTKSKKASILEAETYKPVAVVRDELLWIKEIEHDNRRLIVSYSESRAKKDSADRTRLLSRMLKKASGKKIPLKMLIPNRGTQKFLKVVGGHASLDEERIEEDQQWDGLHGLITNVKDKSASEIIARYGGLWQIEEAFRVNKHNLQMRPIFHWTKKRIHAHISLCFLAYAVLKNCLFRLNAHKVSISIEQFRHELDRIQASILIDQQTLRRYRIPAPMTPQQKAIYKAFKLRRSETPCRVGV